tara:strand:+ start:1567 stop:1788 length:222 start_codon:yes stop_codon:yes gene_type:complete
LLKELQLISSQKSPFIIKLLILFLYQKIINKNKISLRYAVYILEKFVKLKSSKKLLSINLKYFYEKIVKKLLN